jgi:CheY-like chemotaxis protein
MRPRVLVTDDDPSILLLVSTILRRADYTVDTANNGKEALRLSELTQYDVIVLDLMMPQLSGFEVLRLLQHRDVRPRFVVVMSAASEPVLLKAGGSNVFATLRKPFDIGAITDAVGACAAQLH